MKRHVKSILSLALVFCILSGCVETKPYDALSDPNVLWGEEVSYDLPDYIPPGSVILGPKLYQAVKSAGEENLIAFEVQMVYYYPWPTDIDRLAIPDELANDSSWIEKIEKYSQSPQGELYEEIFSYLRENVSSPQEYKEFYYSWKCMEAEGLRERFIEFGFTPVYDLNALSQNHAIAMEQVLTFVGSADSILGLEERLSPQERYHYILDFTEKKEGDLSDGLTDGNDYEEDNDTMLPEQVPDDFSFTLTFGTFGSSSYSSKTGQLKKTAGSVATYFLTEEEMQTIYDAIREMNIDHIDEFGYKDFQGSDPHLTIWLTVRTGDFSKRVGFKEIADYHAHRTLRGAKFLNAVRTIKDILENTEEWKALPEGTNKYL